LNKSRTGRTPKLRGIGFETRLVKLAKLKKPRIGRDGLETKLLSNDSNNSSKQFGPRR